MISERSRLTLAIVGGGLSGALVAIHLLRRAPAGTRIVLIERRPPIGRGVAYGTDCPDHLLNVPAGRMSLFPDHPDHFLSWARRRASHAEIPAAADFLPRPLFGRYINETLADAAASRPSGVSYQCLFGEVTDIEETGTGSVRLTLAGQRSFDAERVVLALGQLPGEYPIKRPLPFYHGPRYVHVPWRPGFMAEIAQHDDLLVVGAGLTAVDIIVQLDRLGHRGTIYALSRRGLRPLSHEPAPPYPHFLSGEPLPKTVPSLVRRIRLELRRAAKHACDWRPVIDAIRPQAQAIWQGFSWPERARFMRHLRPFWEVHRHRLPPATAAIVERMELEGRVKFLAGRLEMLRDAPASAEATCRPRDSARLVTLHVAKVINCTGPRTDYSKYQHPLLVNLLARGLIDHDPLALGLNALPTGEVLRYRGGPSGWLFTLGPPLKGVLWESTAAAEIRVQAQALAARLLDGAPKPVPSAEPRAQLMPWKPES